MTTAAGVAVTTSLETFSTSDPDAGVRVAALYEAHGRTVLGLCRFLLRDATEAEDATQQSFLSAYRSLLGGAVPREPAAWLAAIARNECWLRIKKRMREPLALHDAPSTRDDPLEVAARNADFAALRSGLEGLSRPQREAFILREFAGLSYSELALALGVTEPAVDSLLFRARTSLRRALGAANGAFLPVALRDQLAQLIPGFDQPAAGTVARLVSLPVAAKLAAAGAGAVLVVAGSTGLGRHAAPTAAAPGPAPLRSAERSASPNTPRVSRLPRELAAAPGAAMSRAASPRRSRTARDAGAGDVVRQGGGSSGGTRPEPADTSPDPVPVAPTSGDGGLAPTFGGGAPPSDGDPPISTGTVAAPVDPGSSATGFDDPSSSDAGSSSSVSDDPAADVSADSTEAPEPSN